MKKGAKIGISIASILIVVAILAITIGSSVRNSIKNADTPEMRVEKTYTELTANDYATETEYVQFAAFFVRDLDGDGYVERLDGTCKNLSEKDNLYIELNVLTNGYLENGLITLNTDNNFLWNTSIVTDSVVANTYVGQTSTIELKEKIENGNQKLMWGKISPRLNNNINNYSKINSITLTGTHVIENEDGTETRTEINITRNITVDWYGETVTELSTSTETKYLTDLPKNGETVVSFSVQASETKKDLILQKQVLEFEIPDFNGYDATNAICTDSGVQYEYNPETKILTVIRESEVDDDGYITKTLARINRYNIKVTYPVEAYNEIETDTINITIPVKAYNYGYNNDTKIQEENVFDNPYVSEISKDKIISYVKHEEEPNGYIWKLHTTIGERKYNRIYNGTIKEITKELPTDLYNGNNVTEDDEYNVTWQVDIGKADAIDKIVLEEKTDDNLTGCDNFNGSIDMRDYTTIKNISFKNAKYVLGDAGWIKVYDADIEDEEDALLLTVNKTNWNSVHELNVKTIRIETSSPETSITSLYVYLTKVIDDEKLVADYTEDEFANLGSIYTYLKGTITAPDGIIYDTEQNTAYLESRDFAYYLGGYSVANLGISTSSISSQRTENIDLYINTDAVYDLEEKWKNSIFLIELPEEIVKAKVNEITSSNDNVTISNYYTYKENGKYFIKIYTENDEEDLFKLTINADITANPLLRTTTTYIKMYGYNDFCDNYYMDGTDIYDVDEDELTTDDVVVRNSALTIKNIGSSGLNTTEYITDYDDNPESVTVAPNIADIEKSDSVRTAKININIMNNFDGTLSEILILGRIPYKNNKYVLNESDMGSKFTAQITGAIVLPQSLQDYATVYYSTNGLATRDLTNSENGWKTESEITDWSTIKSYLIDLGDYKLTQNGMETLYYTVEVPAGLGYNTASFSHHAVYYCLDTETGKLATQTEPNKVGIQVIGKYSLEILKVLKGDNTKVIPGVTFIAETVDANGDPLVQVLKTDRDGKALFENLYVEREYTVKEVSAPNDYVLLDKAIKFKATVNNDGGILIEMLQDTETNFTETPEIVLGDDGYYVVKTKIEDEPKYNLQITKTKKNVDTIPVANAIYKIVSEDHNGNSFTVTGRTDENGVVTFSGLYLDEHCTLTETVVGSDYIVSEDEIGFVGSLDNSGNLKITVDNNSPTFNGVATYETNEKSIQTAKVNLDDEAKVKLKLTKVNEEQERLGGIRFTLSSSKSSHTIITDSNGEAFISGLYTDVEYTLKEKEADGYYLADDKKFTITRNQSGNLVVNSSDSEFANAVVIETSDENQNYIDVSIENEKIPTYTLNILKVEENFDEDNIANLTPLDGARYKITSLDTNAEYSISTNAQGIGVLTDLYQYIEDKNVTGKYVIKEIEAPSGYVINPEEITFFVKNNNGTLEVNIENEVDSQTYKTAVVDGTTVTIVLQDKPFFKLNKIDLETGLPLADAQFVIYLVDENGTELDFAKDDKGNYIGTLNDFGYYVVTSDANGVITLPLTNGLYKAVEVTYPDGYMEEVTEEFFKISDGKEDEEEENQTPTSTLQTIEISYIEDLVQFAQNVKNGNTYENYQVLLMNDLDFESASSYRSGTVNTALTKAGGENGFIGIGEYNKPFSGIFDGQNHTISNLYIDREVGSGTYYYQNNLGLFEVLKGTVKNLTVTGEVTARKTDNGYGATSAGIIASTLENAIIDNCHNKVNVTNEERYGNYSSGAGGVVGVTRGGTVVKNCTNEGTIINKSQQEYSHAGGVIGNAGSSSITVINCHNSGTVKCDDSESSSNVLAQVGGIYSFGYGEVLNCSNTGDILATSVSSTCYIGGIVAQGGSITEKCYNTGNIVITKSTTQNSSVSIYAGGITGSGSSYRLIDCYNIGDITVTSVSDNTYLDSVFLGGIIGQSGNVKRCYNTGNIKANFSGEYKTYTSTYSQEKARIGGIAGSGKCDNCYNTGNIDYNFNGSITTTVGIDLYAGGIAGFNSTARNCYNIGNVRMNESSSYLNSYAGSIVGDGTVDGTCAFINSIQLIGSAVVKGTGASDSVLKSLDFYNTLNSDGEWKYNEDAYPTLSPSRATVLNPVTEVNYIEDLVDIGDAIYNGYKYNGATVKLKRSLDFNNDSSYRDPTDTSYGDINRNGIIEPIKTELTTGKGFKPIGISDRVNFDGIFDGKGNEIQNLYINDNENAYVGLFGYVYGTVKNLNVSGQITAKPGTILGSNIVNIGGITGYTTRVENCNSNVNIKALESTNRANIGGVTGNAGTVTNCNNTGKIISYVTYTNTSSYYSYDSAIGGVAGTAINISKSSNKGSITTVKGYTGGIIGQGGYSGSIKECYNLGDISGNESVGGIVGRGPSNGGSIPVRNCYNTGNVFGDRYVGGIVGYGGYISSVTNAYNTGSVSATEYVGAITGYTNTVTDGYYLDTISVDGRYISEKGTAVTDEQLKSDTIYNALNEDSVWQQRSNAYPVLIKSVPENLSNATEITIDNTLKKFRITTAVNGNVGGTITGDGEDPYETVIYKEDNTKAIVMEPAPGYGITKITINGKNFDYELENLDDSYTFPVGYFSEMTEDKHIVVTYKLLDQILTIKKTNTDNEPLKDAEFNISRNIIDDMIKNPKQYHVVRDETDSIDTSTIIANGTYYFEKSGDKFVSNAAVNKIANSYIEIDLTEKTGYYCVTFTGWIKGNGDLYARIVEDTNVYDPTDTTGIILSYPNTQNSSFGRYATEYLEAGKKYYLHFTHVRKTDSSTSSIESLKINACTFDEYWFEKQGDSYISNNQGQDATYAYSYIPIDLTSVSGKVNLTVNAEISSESSDIGFAHVLNNISQTYESSTYGRLFSISGEQPAQDYTTSLEGGLMYYLNLAYYKNGSNSSGDDALKINSVTLSIDGVKTNAYGLANIALQPETYIVTETKAPEGYTLNSEPQTVEVGAGLANEVSFTNVRQTGVTVHHYYKNANGEYTTIKVAEDESYLGDIGKEYTTAPQTDLNGLTIEKDSTGNYVFPSNAVGTYSEEGVVVNYYYESAPIKLTINHYIEGTETKLAEETIVTTPSTLNQLVDGYTVSANGEYDISENADYCGIIAGTYNLSYITSSVNDETNVDDILQYTEDSTLDYYYSLKQYEITTEVKPHTESRTNEETEIKEDVQVNGGTIALEDNSENETVYHGENSVNQIIVTPDENYTVKTITLESTDDDNQTTTTIVYGEGADANSEISYTVNQDGSITISNFENVTENKKVIVEFAPVSGTVVVHYYYEGTGEEYGNEAVKVDLNDGNKAENIELSDLVGEPYTATQRTDIASYYTLSSVSGNSTGNYINGIINIYYYYTYANYEYTIEHYYENLAGNYVIDNNNTVTDFAPYLFERALQESDKKVKTGYSYESQVGAPLTISTDSEENIIKLYYGLNNYNYIVKYLEKDSDTNDANNTVLHEQKTVEDITYGTQVTSSTEVIDITGYNYDSLTPTTLTVSENEANNVITIYYTKKNDLQYTVNYLEKDTNNVLSTAKTVGNKTYQDTVTSSTEVIDITGYNYDSLTPETLTISADNSENVINIYYTKKNDLQYTVNYLEKNTNNVLSTAKTVGNKTYQDTVTSSTEVIDITGYNYDSLTPETLIISADNSENVINIYYTKKNDLQYTVNYLEKGTNNVLSTAKTVGNKTYQDTVTSSTEVIDITGYNYDSLTPETLTISADNSENVINIYYTKKNDLQYTVNYLEKDTNNVLSTAKTVGNKTYLDTVTSSSEVIAIDGYNYDSLTPETLTISADNASNIINIYYTKRNNLSYKVKYLEKDDDNDDSNNTVLHDEKNVSNVIFGTTIASSNEVIDITGYDFNSSDKTTLTVGTAIANNVITLYYTKGTFGYEVHYFYDGVEDRSEKETSTATYKDIITYQNVIDNFGDKVREGYALSDYSPKNTNGELALEISADSTENVINIYYRTQYKIEAEVITHTETTKDGTTTNVTGGTIYEATNTPYETENVFKGDDSTKSIIIVPNSGYEIVNITVTDTTGTVTLDLDEVVGNNGTATLNKDNGFFTEVGSDKKVEVEFRKKTNVIVKYLSATETDEEGNPLVLATEETIYGYESKEFETGRKPVTYYQESSKGITDENDTAITSYDRISLDTNGNAEGTMYSDTLTIIYWYERIPAGIVVRHIEITEADKKAGLDMDSGIELDSELLNGFVSLEETTYRNTYEKYVPADGPVSGDEDLIIVSKDEDSKTAIYKAVVNGEVIGLEFTEYDPADYVVEIRYYYIKQYTLSTEVKTHDEDGQEVKGGTITGEDDDILEIINRLGSNEEEIVITPDYGYKVGKITVNDEEIDLTTLEEDENHVVILPEGYFENVDEDIVVSVEFEKIPAKVITKFVDIDTGEEIEEEVIQEGFVKDPYDTERKEVDSYIPTSEEPENKQGEMVEEDIIVTYYYKKQFKITTDVIEHEEVKYILIEIPKKGKQAIEIITVKGGTISGEDEEPYEIVDRGDSSKKAIILKPDEYYRVTAVKVNGEDAEILNENGYTLAQFEDMQSDLHIEVKYERIPASIKVSYIDETTGESIAETDIQAGTTDSPYRTEPKEIEGYKLVRVEGNKAGRLAQGENTVTYYYKKIEDLTIFERGAGIIEDSINGVSDKVKNTIYNARTGDNVAEAIIGLIVSALAIIGVEKGKMKISQNIETKDNNKKRMNDKFRPF